MAMHIAQILRQPALRWPRRTAVVDCLATGEPQRSWTYAELDAAARKVAAAQSLSFANGEYLIQRDFSAKFCRYLFYFKFFASSNAILLAAGFYDRIHG